GILGRGDVGRADVETGPVGGDRLQAREPRRPRARDLSADPLAKVAEAAAEPILRDPLEPKDGSRVAASELAQLLPLDTLARRRVAVVDQEHLGPGRAEQIARVLRRIETEPMLVDRVLRRLAAEVRRELGDRAAVRQTRRDVRALP